MPENKKVDGIIKMSKEELEKSRKIVLDSIEEEMRKPNVEERPASAEQPKSVDGVVKIMRDKIKESSIIDKIKSKKPDKIKTKPIMSVPGPALNKNLESASSKTVDIKQRKKELAEKARLKKIWDSEKDSVLGEITGEVEPSKIKPRPEKEPIKNIPETKPLEKKSVEVPEINKKLEKEKLKEQEKIEKEEGRRLKEKAKHDAENAKKKEKIEKKEQEKEDKKKKIEKARQEKKEKERLEEKAKLDRENAKKKAIENREKAREKKKKEAIARHKKKIELKKEKKKKKKEKRKKFKENLKKTCDNFIIKTMAASKRTVFYLILLTVLFLLLYSLFAILLLKLNVDTKITRYVSRYLPVPALVTNGSVIEYYTYIDIKLNIEKINGPGATPDETVKLMIIKRLIINNLAKKYNLVQSDNLVDDINKRIIYDSDANFVAITRAMKIKKLIDAGEDFIRTSTRLGDTLGSLTINKDNINDLNFYAKLADLEKDENSDMVINVDGYYIYHVFRKINNTSELSYVKVDAKLLDSYLDESIRNFKLWSLVD